MPWVVVWPRLSGVTVYRIVVDGELSDRFVATFSDMTLARGVGTTSLIGEIADQAHLHGLLAHIADLGLSLISIGPVAGSATDVPDVMSGPKDGHPGPESTS
jgi:hypothetical protein